MLTVLSPPESDWQEDDTRGMPAKPARFAGYLSRALLILFVLSVLPVLCLRWLPPPTSAFMIADRFGQSPGGKPKIALSYRWVGWEGISPHLALAVMAAEDQKFPVHWGFDLDSIKQAWRHNQNGKRVRGASTITQQVAKNLFLWSGRSYLRKGLESYFALLLELFWPKQRILEVYLNVAQFGEGIYGADAASRRLLGKPPANLTPRDAALLSAVLPNPKKLRADKPSAYVQWRARWIQAQMIRMGGTGFLKGL